MGSNTAKHAGLDAAETAARALQDTTDTFKKMIQITTTEFKDVLHGTGKNIADGLIHAGEYAGYESARLIMDYPSVHLVLGAAACLMIALSFCACSRAIFYRRQAQQLVFNNCQVFLNVGDRQVADNALQNPSTSEPSPITSNATDLHQRQLTAGESNQVTLAERIKEIQ